MRCTSGFVRVGQRALRHGRERVVRRGREVGEDRLDGDRLAGAGCAFHDARHRGDPTGGETPHRKSSLAARSSPTSPCSRQEAAKRSRMLGASSSSPAAALASAASRLSLSAAISRQCRASGAASRPAPGWRAPRRLRRHNGDVALRDVLSALWGRQDAAVGRLAPTRALKVSPPWSGSCQT